MHFHATKDIQFFVNPVPSKIQGRAIVFGNIPGWKPKSSDFQFIQKNETILLDQIGDPIRGVECVASACLNADVITAATYLLMDKEDLSRGFMRTLRAIALSEKSIFDPALHEPDSYTPALDDRRVVGLKILLGLQKMIEEDYSSWGYRYPNSFRNYTFDRCVAHLLHVSKGIGNWPGL